MAGFLTKRARLLVTAMVFNVYFCQYIYNNRMMFTTNMFCMKIKDNY